MNRLFKSCSQTFFCFLVFVLCAQQTELKAIQPLSADTSAHETIENYAIEQKIDQLLLLMQKRLVIMHEVARTKWNQNLAIEDRAREQQILASLGAKAAEYGLEEKFVSRFFEAQIEASKEIQKNDFALWKDAGVEKFEKVFSLKEELRFYIDDLNHEMLLLLGKIYGKASQLKNQYLLDHPISNRHSDHIEDAVWISAIAPLYQLK